MAAKSNPFASHRIRPDQVDFIGPWDEVEQCVARFETCGRMGQIVGPHGAGKTTFTFAMERWLAPSTSRIRRIIIRENQQIQTSIREITGSLGGNETTQIAKPLVASVNAKNVKNASGELLIVDGIERISRLNRWLLMRSCRLEKFGLIVTTHRPIRGLPILHCIQPDVMNFREMVNRLSPDTFSQEEIDRVFYDHDGDQREALLSLYDRFHELQRA